jgi:hypothetical protein
MGFALVNFRASAQQVLFNFFFLQHTILVTQMISISQDWQSNGVVGRIS